jgi:hypothetical protein
MVAFLVGVAAIVAAVYWLHLKSRRDAAECAALLGLSTMVTGRTERGTSAEGFNYHESVVAEGLFHGTPAALSVRNIRSAGIATAKRDRGSFTVLTFAPAMPIPISLRLQPAGAMHVAEWVTHGSPAKIATGDEEFDAAWHLYAEQDASAIILLTPALRAELMRLYRSGVPGGETMQQGAAYKLAAGVVAPNFEITQQAARCYVTGTPMKQSGETLLKARSILASLAGVT